MRSRSASTRSFDPPGPRPPQDPPLGPGDPRHLSTSERTSREGPSRPLPSCPVTRGSDPVFGSPTPGRNLLFPFLSHRSSPLFRPGTKGWGVWWKPPSIATTVSHRNVSRTPGSWKDDRGRGGSVPTPLSLGRSGYSPSGEVDFDKEYLAPDPSSRPWPGPQPVPKGLPVDVGGLGCRQ